MDRRKLLDEIKREEGCRLRAYRDTVGVLTVGFGHTGPDVKEDTEWTLEQAEEALSLDIDGAIHDSCGFDFFLKMGPVRQRAIVSMVYQLGARGVSGFKKFCAACRQSEWYAAAIEMLDSKWHMAQTPRRAERMAYMVLTGLDLPDQHAAVQRVLSGVLHEVNQRRAARES